MNVSGPACTRASCGHWESGRPSYLGHCSHRSCPNYMDGCPLHQNYSAAGKHLASSEAMECVAWEDDGYAAGRAAALRSTPPWTAGRKTRQRGTLIAVPEYVPPQHRGIWAGAWEAGWDYVRTWFVGGDLHHIDTRPQP